MSFIKRDNRRILPIKEMNKEPSTCEIITDYSHPSLLFPEILKNAASGIIQATGFVAALFTNNLVQLYIDKESHHDASIALLISFFVFIFASSFGALLIRISEKWKYDLSKNIPYHTFDFNANK